MTSGQAGPEQHGDRSWPGAIASLVVGAAFLALWFWLLPPWLGFQVDTPRAVGWRWLAALPSALGFAVALRCIWDFGRTGHGTPMPLAPPKRLVVVGFYRYVRNPMYVGFFVGWAGLWVIFGRASWPAIAGTAAAMLGVALFVRLYEEPTLRRLFGGDYEDYCRNVPRWIPRMSAWEGNRRLAAVALALAALAALATPAAAQDHAAGSLVVEGKPIAITQVYAFAQQGFFDHQKQDVVILLCDAPVPPAAIRDQLARGDLVKAGKLHCIEQTIDADRQVINFKVQHERFHMPEGGGSTEHRFDATTFDGKTIAGRAWTRSPQKSFDDVPYSYDVTVSAAIEPKK